MFHAHYSSIMAPLIQLIRKDQPFFGGLEVDNVFQSLKASFIITPLLIRANPSKPFVLETDASDFAIGAFFHNLEKTIFFILSVFVFVSFSL